MRTGHRRDLSFSGNISPEMNTTRSSWSVVKKYSKSITCRGAPGGPLIFSQDETSQMTSRPCKSMILLAKNIFPQAMYKQRVSGYNGSIN